MLENDIAERYAFQFNSEKETLDKNINWYAGHPFFSEETSNLQNADVITDHPPEEWIKWEEQGVGKIIQVKVNITLVDGELI